jgi:putative flippase GtrA
MKQFFSRQFVTFLVTGGVAAAVNFSSRLVYNQWFDYSTSVVLAYLNGMITAFVLARLFVFTASEQSVGRSVFYFVVVNLVAVLQTWAISMSLAYWVLPSLGVRQWTHEMAHAVGIVVPVFTSYIGHKRFSFR